MPATLLTLVFGRLFGDALRLVGSLAVALLLCLLVAVQVIPAALWPRPDAGPAPGAAPPAPPADLVAIFAEVEGRTGIAAHLLMAIAHVESGFDPRAVGPRIERFAGTEDEHALGMMQFLPSTYRVLAARVDTLTGVRLGELGVWHPRHAVFAAALYLRDHGAPDDLRQALYAYNHDWAYVDRVLAIAAAYASAAPGSEVAARALAFARSQLGTPYRWGGTGDGGFDCSGLTQWAYAAAGVRLPRTAEAQYHATQRLSRDQLQPGDLVFFNHPDTQQPGVLITHVGLYAGNDQMIDAPAPGAVVRVDPIWRSFAGGGRVLVPGTS